MAYSGKVISNTCTGQSIKFVTTAEESQGDYLEMITEYAPYSLEPAAHYHPLQVEQFNVIEGELTLRLNGRVFTLVANETIEIPPNTIHAMWNASGSETVVHWKVIPALGTEYLLETAMGLAASGKTNDKGMPDLRQVALTMPKFKREYRLAKPAYVVQRCLFGIIDPVARLSGYKSTYPEYID